MKSISYEVKAQLGVITINNPPLNLLSKQVTDELLESIGNIEKDLPRALLIRSSGRAFSGGADVARFQGMSPLDISSELDGFLSLIQRIEKLPIPTVAAVHGVCAAGGLELALAFDLILAGESAQFAQAEAIIGAIPFGGGVQRLAERAGTSKAKEIFYNSGFFSSRSFEQWGIVNRVLADDQLESTAFEEAGRLSNGPTKAYAYAKQIVNTYVETGKPASDEVTLELGIQTFETSDFRNGVISLLKEGPGKAVFEGI
jgi:enoyl-CoA hydratase/carnithine racemase